MTYLLDANVFIQAKNLHYGLDFCPAFWDWLIAGNSAQQVFSIEKVGDEIFAVADELSNWAAQRGPDFFLKPDANLLPGAAYGQRLGNESTLRAGCGEHIPASRRLLPRGSCTCLRAYGRHPRDCLHLNEEDQDS